MAIIDDLINSGLSDEAIIDLLMEKKRRERNNLKEKKKLNDKPEVTETKVKTLAHKEGHSEHSELRQAVTEEVIIEDINIGANNDNTRNDTSVEALKTAISEMADNVLHRVGQMCVGTKLDTKSAIQIICQHLDAKQVQGLEKFTDRIDTLIAGQKKLEAEMSSLQLKSDQSITDGTSIRNGLALIQDKQNELEQDISRARIMGPTIIPEETQQFYPNVTTNVYPRPEAEVSNHPQAYFNNFNPQHQPNPGASGGFSEFYNDFYNSNGHSANQNSWGPQYNGNGGHSEFYEDFYNAGDHYDSIGMQNHQIPNARNHHQLDPQNTLQTQVFTNVAKGSNQSTAQSSGQSTSSNLMPRANIGTKQKTTRKVKTVYENSNMKKIPGMPHDQPHDHPYQPNQPDRPNQPYQGKRVPSAPPAPRQKPKKQNGGSHWNMSPSQIEAQKEVWVPGGWQNRHYPPRDEVKAPKPGAQQTKTNEEMRCAKEILFFGEEEPQYINKQQYDQDLFAVIICALSEVSTTHLKSAGFNTKEGDVVRVTVVDSWTGPEEHNPMVAEFKDVETCNRAKRAIKLGNFYKRRTHSRFGKYKITGNRKIDDENREFLHSIRHRFARPSTPKAVRARRKKERDERNNNEDYRREKEAEKEANNKRKLRVANTKDFDTKITNVTIKDPKQVKVIKKLAEVINNGINVKVPQPNGSTGNGNTGPHRESNGDTKAEGVYTGKSAAQEPPTPPPQTMPLKPPQEWQQQQQQRQQQLQQQHQQQPRRIHRVAWNLDVDENILHEYVDRDGDVIGKVVETAENDKMDQNGNKTNAGPLSVLRSWAERVEDEENRTFDYMNTTNGRTAPSGMAEANQGETDMATNGEFSIDMPNLMTFESGSENSFENGRTAPPGSYDTPREYVIDRAESELKLTLSLKSLGRTAPPNGKNQKGETERKTEEEEADPGRTGLLDGSVTTETSTPEEETEIESSEEDDEDGRTVPTPRVTVENKDPPGEEAEKEAAGKNGLEFPESNGNQTVRELEFSELQEQNNSTDIFLTDEEGGNESGFESQDIAGNNNEEVAEVVGDAVEDTIAKEEKHLEKNLENINSPENGDVTPQKIVLASKQMIEVNQRATRSKSLKRLEGITEEEDDVQTQQ